MADSCATVSDERRVVSPAASQAACILRAMKLRIALLCLLLLLVACGGGGSSVGGSINVGNMPPQFTSPATVLVPEDTSGVFYNATASDIDGNSVTFRIVGGDDASSSA